MESLLGASGSYLVILATQEIEIRGLWFQASLGK
jgi:hypothetical protein